MTWPTVPLYDKDSYALDILSNYLAQGKEAPFNQVLVEDQKLTSSVRSYNSKSELAGQFRLSVSAFSGKDLDEVMKAVDEAFAKFESEGIPQSALDRIKAGEETQFYSGLSSVVGKGFKLAQYEIFAGDPGYVGKDIANILDVTTQDVMRVYNTYIKGKNYIATSFVPKGQVNLGLEKSVLAEIEEEKILDGAEASFDASGVATYEKTPSSFDRSVEPPYGDNLQMVIPQVWEEKLNSGLEVYGIENDEVPLVNFQVSFRGSLLLETPEKVGVSNLLASLMNKGTATKTTAQLQEAIKNLGASIWVSAGDEEIVFSGRTLSKNYNKTLALVEEIILEPRWDQEEFDILKRSVKSQILQQEAQPNSIASNQYAKLIYGDKHMLSHNLIGSSETIEAITIEDLKNFYTSNLSPTVSKMYVVGDVSKSEVIKSVEGINTKMKAKEVVIPEFEVPARPESATVYFYDVPGAKQSVLNVG